MFSRYGGPQVRRPPSSSSSVLSLLVRCTHQRWYILFSITIFIYLWFGTTISPGYPFLLRNIRWTRGWLRDHPSFAATFFPSSVTKVSVRSPSSLLDAVLDFCRPNEGVRTENTESSSNNNPQSWKDSGELFYDPPSLSIEALATNLPSSASASDSVTSTFPKGTSTSPFRGGTSAGSDTSTNSLPSSSSSSTLLPTFLTTPVGLKIRSQSIPMYTISCPDHLHRLEYQKKSLNDAGFFTPSMNNLYVIPCETLNNVDENCILLHGLFRRSGLRRGEAGVALAHVRAWQTAYSRAMSAFANAAIDTTVTDPQRWYHAIFLEDDATFLPHSAEYLQDILDLIAEQQKAIEVLALWNGDWLWNTEKQQKIINGSDVLAYGNKKRGDALSSTQPMTKSTPEQFTVWEATGTMPYVPGGVAYMLSLRQIEILLTHIFPIDKPLDALLATGAAHGGHFMLSPAEPRAIDKRIPKGTPLVMTGSDSSYNVS